MGFLGVCTAIYDYQPQAEGELEIHEGDLLYILDKDTEDNWWKAKKKAERDDEDEPEGLVPNNYVEEAQPIHRAKALYDYTRQTDEEVSFSEDAELVVYDVSDPDWTLVNVNSDYGFAPSNYIELIEEDAGAFAASSGSAPMPTPPLPQRPAEPEEDEESGYEPASEPAPDPARRDPAAAIADILHKQHATIADSSPPPQPPRPAAHEPEDGYDTQVAFVPALPERPQSQASPPTRQYSPPEPSLPPRPNHADIVRSRGVDSHVRESPPYNRVGEPSPLSPAGYHLYNVNEMVEAMGKRKKMPTTLGINVATGTIFISPEGEGQQQEWTAEKLSHYSIEGKHVFMDLVRPSRSVDLHAGAKDTAEEIVSALGEIVGAYKAKGLREVIEAGSGGAGQKKGQVLYDFMAQGDDEVTVAVGDEVVILDDSKSDEWWMVRRMKNGKEGVVPSSYVEITGFISTQPSGIESGLSAVERNRLEESRLARQAIRNSRTDSMDSRNSSERHNKRDSRKSDKPRPDPTKTRQWTDRTKTFTVEAQFIGLHDGKIHLHKMNGVKIAVPIAKMSVEDLEYVEKATGVSLDEDKPLSDIRRRSTRTDFDKSKDRLPDHKPAGATVGPKPDYDWFDFFLKAGVGPHQCERYSQNFVKDSMDEGILPDITPETLRTLGLKEGDILRVMRYLDNMFNRTGSKSKLRNVSFGGEEVIGNGEHGGSSGLFSGPGGMLRNNTRKGRPAPTVQAGDAVDPKAFEQKEVDASKPTDTPSSPQPPVEKHVETGFEDSAWEVKQSKQDMAPSAVASKSPPAATSAPAQQQLTGAMADLSLLSPPLQPIPAQPTSQAQATSPPPVQPQPTAVPVQPQPQQPQPTGATPSFFAQVGQSVQPGRQRPPAVAPQATAQNSLLPPPPQRPLSAPQNIVQQSAFAPPPLQAQLTGIPQNVPHFASPGQSLGELNQVRYQSSLQPQQTGYMGQSPFQNGMLPHQPGFSQQQGGFPQQSQQPQFGFQQQPTLQPTGFGFSPQQTGFAGFQQSQQPMHAGINSVLPPALQSQPTGLQSQPTGMNGMRGMQFSPSPPPAPPIPQQPTASPLVPQKTGPPPSVRFGVNNESPKKLTPQPTGLRANLAQATPTNPFGF